MQISNAKLNTMENVDNGAGEEPRELRERNNTSQSLSLTSFLFGNIDTEGELEGGDFLDPESKKNLDSLVRLGFGSLIRQITNNEDDDEGDEEEEEEDEDEEEEDGEITKSPSAIDFSDFNEMLDDDSEEESIKSNEVEDSKTDYELMPPPPPPNTTEGHIMNAAIKPVTPLAAMLPSKYLNVDVKTLFPDFRENSVLKFSKLFGVGKSAHLPKIWRHVKRKRKRKQQSSTDNSADLIADKLLSEDYNFSSSGKGFEFNFAHVPEPEQCESDDEDKLLRPQTSDHLSNTNQQENDYIKSNRKAPKEADWRFGPAQQWYDILDVSSLGDGFDYGFQLKENRDKVKVENGEEKLCKSSGIEFPDDAFHMVTQYNWEDDIIWDGDDVKHKLNQKRKNMAAGWVPSSYNRTAQVFSHPAKPQTLANKSVMLKNQILNQAEGDDTWYSIFPVENEELIYEKWEDNIIWDPDAMDHMLEPNILTLDPNDENIILGIPEDIDPSTLSQGNETPVKVKIPHPHVKKSKILLGKAGVITTIEEESPPPPPKSPDKDPFNLSNDEYYQPKSTEQTIKMSMAGGLLQHSTPVVELQSPFVPTFMGEKKLRVFHRPPMKHFSHGPLSSSGPHPVHSLTKEIKRKAKIREQERLASGGGDVFFMRTSEDLTGKDGDLIMVEYCEEFPPIMSMVGMCSRVKNYYKRKAGHDKGPPDYKFGETCYAHTSPFLGSMHSGQSIQTIENNMSRAPIYEHKMPQTDFLVIRTRNSLSIRELDSLFLAGQHCPLYEVPGPNSKRANNFIRDFLQVFIYRLFWKSSDTIRRIKMDEIKRAFPAHSESSIRKRLKPCADFKRTGTDSNWWVIKPEFRLPTEDEIRAMVSPEQCCAFFSMLAAQQRLKDAGYGDKFLSALEDDNDDDTQKLDDEVKVAPWHTTRAYIQAVRLKCLLQLTGPADPTGCGEGFSYIRIPNKPTQNKEEQEQQPKRTVTGTDADLRKLSLNDAKKLLRNYGVPEEEIKKLTRWEVIDVVRTLSTEKAKAGEEGMNKFSRGNRFSIAEHQERYKEECQRIFDLQNRVLASEEVLSTDEGSSSEEENDSDMEEKGKYIENILANKKTSTQMTLEKEEEERKQLHKMFMAGDDADPDKKKGPKKDEDENSQYGYGKPGRVLKIVRTFRNADGEKYVRTEIVRKTPVIDTYIKIRTTKDEAFIREFAGQFDETRKEEIKRERRRLQEQLRRIKRNQERLEKGIITPPKAKKPKLKPDLKLKCGACGQVGHMRTNKACPNYSAGFGTMSQTVNVPVVSEHDPSVEKEAFEENEDLINIDGTKLKIHSKVFKNVEDSKKRSNQKVPRDPSKANKRRRAGTIVHCDYLKKKNKSVNRRRIDPVVTLSTIFEVILNEMRDTYDSRPFMIPVNPKMVPDYYNIIQHPMDLATIRDNLRQNKYQSREEFLCDINQIVENSKIYNGINSTLTLTASKMLGLCIDRFSEKDEKLMKLEKAINPLLDDNDQVAFDYILDNILNMRLFAMQEAWPFMKPVNKKTVKDYYEIIENPIDLQTIAKKVKTHKYHNRHEFISDIALIFTNSEKYNGAESTYTQKAKTLLQACKDILQEYDGHINQLEQKIAIAQERAMEAAENDSLGTGVDEEHYEAGPSHDILSDGNRLDYYGIPEDSGNSSMMRIKEQTLDQKKRGRKRPKNPTPRKRPPKQPKNKPITAPTAQVVNSQKLLEQDLQFSDDEEKRIHEMQQQQRMDVDIKPDIHSLQIFPHNPFSNMESVLQPSDEMLLNHSTINKDLAVSESEDEQHPTDQDNQSIWFD